MPSHDLRLIRSDPLLQWELLRRLARSDLTALFRLSMPLVAPAATFIDGWFYRAIAYEVDRLSKGDSKWLGIAMPPRGGKSILMSVVLPAFLLGRDPSLGIMCLSYSRQLAAKFANDFRTLVSSPLYREIFPEMRVDPRKDNETETRTTAGGFRLSTSIEGTVTGRGAEYIICDDPLQPADATSDATRERVNDFLAQSLSTRTNNKQSPKFAMVMQRLHPRDPIGFLQERGRLELLNLPARTDVDRKIRVGPDKYHLWKAGELLAPGIWPPEFLENQRALMGSHAFDAQYLGHAVPVEGRLAKWRWFGFYDVLPEIEPMDRIVDSWDTAAKAGELNDYSVCVTALMKGNRYYIRDIFRDKLEYPALKQAVIERARKANFVLVEDSMSGQALVQELRDLNLPDLANPIPIRPEHDKVMRLQVASPVIEAGQVLLPRNAQFLDEFKTELLGFPHGFHDDQVDAFTQLINWGEGWRRRHQDDAIIGIPILIPFR